MLAYISPEEAQVLKDRGGSGKPHADTGIPSFELDDDLALQGGTETITRTPQATTPDTGGATIEPSTTSQFSDFYPTQVGSSEVSPSTTFTPSGSFAGTVGGYGQEGQGYTFEPGGTPTQAAPADNAVALQN